MPLKNNKKYYKKHFTFPTTMWTCALLGGNKTKLIIEDVLNNGNKTLLVY